MSVFKFTVPENWDKDYFLFNLYLRGTIAVIKTDEFGVIPTHGSLTGSNVFYTFNKFIVTNPLLPNKTYNIGKDCTIIKIEPDYCGITDALVFYTSMLAEMRADIDTDLINSKLSYVFTATNRNAAESFKKLYDNIASGQPAVVADRALKNKDGTPAYEVFSQNLSQNYIVPDILSDMRKVENMFATDFGIPNANTEKRERATTDEINANNVETYTRVEMWFDSITEAFERTRRMFNIPENELKIEWRYDPHESINNDRGTISDRSDTV